MIEQLGNEYCKALLICYYYKSVDKLFYDFDVMYIRVNAAHLFDILNQSTSLTLDKWFHYIVDDVYYAFYKRERRLHD